MEKRFIDIDTNIIKKYNKLKQYLEELGSVAIAFSGGVDSTFLLKVAGEVLGNNAIAVTSITSLIPDREKTEVTDFCTEFNIKHIIVKPNPFLIDGFDKNPKDRCYICKKAIFSEIISAASKQGIAYVAEGSNVDDEGDYRPGLKAIAELEVKSPLRYAGLTKNDIRILSKAMQLKTWDKPSYACLASRFVYGETITEEKLKMIDKAEQYLFDLGFFGIRVRIHSDVARIELDDKDIDRFMEKDIRLVVDDKLKKLGFNYVSLDLKGYTMGSMNIGI